MRSIALILAIATQFAIANEVTLNDVIKTCQSTNSKSVEVTCSNKNLILECSEELSLTEADFNICSISTEDMTELQVNTNSSFTTEVKGGGTPSQPTGKLSCNQARRVRIDNAQEYRLTTCGELYEIYANQRAELRASSDAGEHYSVRAEIRQSYERDIKLAKRSCDKAKESLNKEIRKKCKKKDMSLCRNRGTAARRRSCRQAARLVRGWNSYRVVEREVTYRVPRAERNPRNRVPIRRPRRENQDGGGKPPKQ